MRSGAVLVLLVVASMVGCGGSASETPWPREPEGAVLGPAGELGPEGEPANVGESAAPAEPRGEGAADPAGDGQKPESAQPR